MHSPPDQKEWESELVMDTKEKCAKLITLLTIVANNVDLFKDGFAVEWFGISTFVYDDYDDSGNRIPGTAKAKMAKTVKALRRITGGIAVKDSNDYYFWMDIKLNGDAGDPVFRVQSSRENVCERKVIGTKVVDDIDYDNAPKIKKTVEIVEWECGIILDGAE